MDLLQKQIAVAKRIDGAGRDYTKEDLAERDASPLDQEDALDKSINNFNFNG